MYDDHGLICPLLQSFPHNFTLPDEELLCCYHTENYSGAPHMGNLMQTSSILEYDLGGEGDLFKAPEPIIEEPEVTLDPISAAMTILSNGQDVMTETLKVAGIESMQNEHLDDVLYECMKELLEKYEISTGGPEMNEVKLPIVEPELDKIRAGGGDAQLQKSVSSGCLNSMEWVNGCNVRPHFLEFQGMDFETAFGLRRAFSEGDIQALGSTSTVRTSSEKQLTISELKTEEREQKLSRYRRKKSRRNFGRKIKYACRKALADSQPRVRGRFVKSDESELSKPPKDK